MFLDLKSSTTIAEELGHIRYSEFIQECFADLSVVKNHNAEVYQYVGDEVVLTWLVKGQMDFMQVLNAFWAYEDRLQERSAHYLQKFGRVPIFKAGINLGDVTTVEVGEFKREIAHHGDTLNITARIQERCNAYEQVLLVSGAYQTQITDAQHFAIELMGEEVLKGKHEAVKIYAVSRT